MLIGLIYVSDKSYQLSPVQFENLVEKAGRNNKKHNVTGFICELEEHYLQYLEGDKSQVASIMDIIKKDDRHHDILEHTYSIKNRHCSQWSMVSIPNGVIGSVHFGHLIQSVLNMLKKPAFDKAEIDSMIVNLLEKWISVGRLRGQMN